MDCNAPTSAKFDRQGREITETTLQYTTKIHCIIQPTSYRTLQQVAQLTGMHAGTGQVGQDQGLGILNLGNGYSGDLEVARKTAER